MDFTVVVIFIMFFVGVVLAVQGIIGKEPLSEGRAFGIPIDLDNPGMTHPPERHRLRLVLIGIGIMAGAVLLGIAIL